MGSRKVRQSVLPWSVLLLSHTGNIVMIGLFMALHWNSRVLHKFRCRIASENLSNWDHVIAVCNRD